MSDEIKESSPWDRSPEVSVVLPCLNEAQTLADCIKTIKEAFAIRGLAGEIVVADNGSTDRSAQIAVECGARLVRATRRGYGSALRAGIEAASGKYIVFGDADGSYDFMDVPRFLDRLRDGCQLVMGNRFKGKIHVGAMPWLHRYLGNPVLSALGRRLYGVQVGDFHCGLRGFSAAAFERMQLRSTGMEFASEMVIKAALADMRICEIPIELRPDGRDRPPHLRTWRDGWRHLRFMMLMCPRWLFWLPGSVLYCVSLVLAIALELGAVLVGPMRFSIHTLLVIGTAMIIAVQLMTFAIYTERLANLIGLGASSTAGSSTRRWLCPPKLRLPKLSLEWGLGIGLMFLVCGFGLLIWQTWAWSRMGFAPLDPEVAMRVMIPAIVCTTHGFQIIFGAFFLSFLKLVKSQLNESSQA